MPMPWSHMFELRCDASTFWPTPCMCLATRAASTPWQSMIAPIWSETPWATRTGSSQPAGVAESMRPLRAWPQPSNDGRAASGPFGTVAGGGAVHEHRVDGVERLVVDFEALGDALAKVLYEDVGRLDELVHDLAPFGGPEVDGDATFVAVVGFEVCVAPVGQCGSKRGCPGQSAAGVAVEGLDLDDVGSHVAHHYSGHRAELPHGPVENSDALQRPGNFAGAAIEHWSSSLAWNPSSKG